MRLIVIGLTAVLMVGGAVRAGETESPPGAARDAAIAKFKEGVASFDAKDFQSALVSFKAAYDLNPSWKLLYNIAHCNAALKNYGVALDFFEKYLAAGGDEIPGERRDEVLGELDRLRKMVGDLEVNAPDGLTVVVDGYDWGVTPLPGTIPVPSGAVLLIELKRGDAVLFSVNKSVRGGATAVVTYTERDETVVSAGPPATTEPTAIATPILPPVVPPAAPPPAQKRRKISPVPFWICAGLTVALGGTTIALDAAVYSKKKDVENQDDADDLKPLQAAGIGTFAGTMAAAVATGVLAFFTDFKGERNSSDVSVGLFGSDENAGATLTGRF